MEKRTPGKSARAKRQQHHRRVFGLGLAVVCCALAGILLLVGMFIRAAVQQDEPGENPENPTEAIEKYDVPIDFSSLKPGTVIQNGALLNFVKHEFPAFATPDDIPMQHLVSFGVWEALKSERYAGELIYKDSGALIVPATTVTKTIKAYFPLENYIIHQGTDVHGTFSYDEETKQYSVPIFGLYDVYLPRVASIQKEGDNYVLGLEYILSTEQAAYEEGGASPQAKKKANLTVCPTQDGFTILSQTGIVTIEDGGQ